MYSPVSDQFLRACRESGKRVTVADLYYNNALVHENIPVVSGEVSADSVADIRRSAGITIINPSRVNASESSQSSSGLPVTGGLSSANGFDIYGAEILIKSGFEYSNNTQELIPMGRFMVWDISEDHNSGDVFELELFDRSKYLMQTGILKFYDASGQMAQDAMQALVNMSLPFPESIQFDPAVIDVRLPGGTIYDTNVLSAVLAIADVLGSEFYFNLEGQPVCTPKKFITTSTTSASAVVTLDCGDNGVLTELNRRTSREGVFNGIGVYGYTADESTPQPFAEVFDMTPSSKTYYLGSFGKAFKRIDRQELTTDAECLTAAKAELAKSIGGASSVDFSALMNTALEPGDIILAGFPDDHTELHLIESINFDFDAGSSTFDTRGQNGS